MSNLALCGAPFLAGFYSKDIILERSLYLDRNWLIILMIFLATGITVSYSVRLSFCVLWGTFNFYSLHNWGDEKLCEVIPMFVLIVGAVVGGRFFIWSIFYGDGCFFLISWAKVLTLVVVLVGGLMGWGLVVLKDVRDKKLFLLDRKMFFGFTYMWFLVHLSRQGLLKGGLKSGSFLLYQGDRG